MRNRGLLLYACHFVILYIIICMVTIMVVYCHDKFNFDKCGISKTLHKPFAHPQIYQQDFFCTKLTLLLDSIAITSNITNSYFWIQFIKGCCWRRNTDGCSRNVDCSSGLFHQFDRKFRKTSSISGKMCSLVYTCTKSVA